MSNNNMTSKSPFAIQKANQGIGGEPKSVKKLRSGDLLVETVYALQTKSFLLAKTFLDCPLTASPHKSLNSSRGVISEPDLICTPEAEILEGFSGQGVIQVRRITIKKMLRSTKLISKLIAPQLSQTYAQVAKSSTATSTTQTDENITQIKCPPLQLLQPLLSVPQPDKYPSITSVSTSSSTTQANLLPSASSIKPTTEIESRLPEPISSTAAPDNSLNTSTSSLSAETHPLTRSNKSAALSTEIQT
ncbi:putative RNA-directed DNA polymerase from transposon BS [Trichonephila clavipes]|nr:putative RNA-directed DNA polymerase from transposon BS [Trichonephila clavipes]